MYRSEYPIFTQDRKLDKQAKPNFHDETDRGGIDKGKHAW